MEVLIFMVCVILFFMFFRLFMGLTLLALFLGCLTWFIVLGAYDIKDGDQALWSMAGMGLSFFGLRAIWLSLLEH